jgi:hypothetical protein
MGPHHHHLSAAITNKKMGNEAPKLGNKTLPLTRATISRTSMARRHIDGQIGGSLRRKAQEPESPKDPLGNEVAVLLNHLGEWKLPKGRCKKFLNVSKHHHV